MPPRIVRCPECNSSFDPSPDDAERRRLACPDCGARFANPAWDDPDDDRDRAGDSDDRPRRRRRPPIRSGGASKLLLFLLLGGGVLVLGCCGGIIGLGVWYLKPTSFPEPTEDYADARKSFRTTLLRQQPAPQPWQQELPPTGRARDLLPVRDTEPEGMGGPGSARPATPAGGVVPARRFRV